MDDRDHKMIHKDLADNTAALRAVPADTATALDAQLRTTPLPVSGTVAVTGIATAANQASILTALALLHTDLAGIQTTLTAIAADAAEVNGNTRNIDITTAAAIKPNGGATGLIATVA